MRLENKVVLVKVKSGDSVWEANPSAPKEYWPKGCAVTHEEVNASLRGVAQLYPVTVEVLKVMVAYSQEAWTDHFFYVELVKGKPTLKENVYSIGGCEPLTP